MFPISINKEKGYFVNADGTPFFWNGDTCWKLFWEFTYEEAVVYLKDRAKKGFNVIMVHLLPHRIHKCNRYAELPFMEQGDITRLNPNYFDYVERVISFAKKLNIGLAIAPMWLSKWEQDWHKYFKGEAALKYSELVAKRLSHLNNIVAFIHGGDDDAIGRHDSVREAAKIYKKFAPDVLATFHSGIGAGWKFFGEESWYDFCFAYTYHYDEFINQLKDARKRYPNKPAILGETHYEGNYQITAHTIRKYAYTSVFLGNAGHTYGNKEIWMYTMFWSNELFSECSHHMVLLNELANEMKFERFVGDFCGNEYENVRCIMPDASDKLIPCAVSENEMYAYVDDYRWFSPKEKWKEGYFVDPVSGRKQEIVPVKHELIPFNTRVLQIPGKNAGGDLDWILYMRR